MIESYDQNIGMLTNKVAKKLSSYLNEQLEQFNLTSEQWTVLLTLANNDKINQKLLAEIAGKDQSTLARILDILETKTFVKRQPSTKDRRSFVIHITNEGIELANKVSPFLEILFNNLLDDIPNEKLLIYNEVLTTIYKNVENKQIK